jgi:tripartite-type tricarboxylate transporter receptor subunit TctC
MGGENRMSNMTHAVMRTIALLMLAAAASTATAQTQAYPTKPIRFIVAYPPGGTSDILARLIGSRLTESWRQQVIVDNRAGASGNIAADLTARSTPDGYTLMLTDIGNLVITSLLFQKLSFDILKDFVPVTTVSYSPHLLLTHPKLPVKTAAELIAYAKSQPGKLNYPTALGGAPHMAGLALAQRGGIDWVYVPTKGGAQSVAAVMAGEGDVFFLGILQTIAHVKSGRLKAIAISSEQRLPTLPDLPTVGETLPGFVTGSWQGIVAPARTPRHIVTQLNREIARILSLPDVKEILMSQGTTPIANSSEATHKWLASERERWAQVVKGSGFRLD